MHALLLLVIAIVLLAYGAASCCAGRAPGRRSSPSWSGVLFVVWFFTTDEVPADFTRMTPYVTTLLVLAFASQRLRMPAADGQSYRRGRGRLTWPTIRLRTPWPRLSRRPRR